MPRHKIDKIKSAKVSKKSKTLHSKKKLRTKVGTAAKESEVLLSTELPAASMTHGHIAYQHNLTEEKVKKLDDRSQRLIMYIGISLIMVVIVGFWIMSLKNVLGPEAFSLKTLTEKNPATKTDFEGLKNDLSNTFSDVKKEIKNLEDSAKGTPTSTSNPALISGTTKSDLISNVVLPALVSGANKLNSPSNLPN